MSQLGGHVGATGSVSDVTVKHRVRTFLKNMGYSAELVDEAIKNCRDADHCVQYLDARAPKQTTGKQPLLTPFAQQKRDDLRRQLQSRGCKDAHIKIAVANCKIDAMSSGQAFSECYRLIEEELVPVDNLSLRESEAPSPTAVASNWKEKVASPALANRAQLKHMGYTDEQIDTAVTQGYGDLDSCVKYLISLESSAGQQPTPLTSAQTTTTPNPAFAAKGSVASSLASSQSDTGVSSDGTLLVYNGWLYKTAHSRKIASTKHSQDGLGAVHVPIEWQLCHYDHDVGFICSKYGWSSNALALADGSVCATAACLAPLIPGNKTGLSQIERVGTSVRTYKATNDVLLKKRVSSIAASGAIPIDSKPQTNPSPSQVPSSTLRDKVLQMGYSEQQIDSAIGMGCLTPESCVDYFHFLDQETSKRSKVDQPDASSQLEYNGWIYRTAHSRRVNQGLPHAADGMNPIEIGLDWELCRSDHDVLHVCKTFGWGSHALVLADGTVCLTAACKTGSPGAPIGSDCLIRAGNLVSCARAWLDVLLKKRAIASNSSATSSACSLQSPATSATSDDVIKQQLWDLGWSTDGINYAVFRVKQLSGVATLPDCNSFLQKTGIYSKRASVPAPGVASEGSIFGPAPSKNAQKFEFSLQPATSIPQTSTDRVITQLKSTMISLGYQASHVESAVQHGCSDMNSCIDYISHHYRDVSPPPASAVDASAACRTGGAAAAVNLSPTPYKISSDGKHLEYKGWLYRTAHERRVDQMEKNSDGKQLVEFPRDWEVCPWSHEAQDVVKNNPWSSQALVLENGIGCQTSACHGGFPGEAVGSGGILQSGTKIYTTSHQNDILLRKRAPSPTEPAAVAVAPAAAPQAAAFSDHMSHQEMAKRTLLCIGSPTDHAHRSLFEQPLLSRQDFDTRIDSLAASGNKDPVEEVYTHSRLGLQAALHLCHPSFAAEDDYMVVVARASIRANVLAPLAEAGWDVCPQIDALWRGDRGAGVPAPGDQLISVALADHPSSTKSSTLNTLPLAFPAAYSEIIAIYMACRDCEASNGANPECADVLARIRRLRDADATFRQMLLYADNPGAAELDGLPAKQVLKTLSESLNLKTLPAYRPELKHFAAVEGRRRHRCLCVCSAHLAIQSKKLFYEGKIDDKTPNGLQPEIDKLICVATAAHFRIGELVSLLFDKAPYRLPSVITEPLEVTAFHQDLMSLIEDEQGHDTIASYFTLHLKWLLDAASGAIALTEDMLLDASSTDCFARALIRRAAMLKFPLLAAAETTGWIEKGEFKTENEEIKGHLSSFADLGPMLDRFWVSQIDPTTIDSRPIRCHPDLARTSTRSARWLLAVEREMYDCVKRLLLDLREASKLGSAVFLTRASISLQSRLMRRVVKLLKDPKGCVTNPQINEKIIDSDSVAGELQFFYDMIVPRLAEAGFSYIQTFINAVQRQMMLVGSHASSSPNFIDQVPVGSQAPTNEAWVTEFKKLWKETK